MEIMAGDLSGSPSRGLQEICSTDHVSRAFTTAPERSARNKAGLYVCALIAMTVGSEASFGSFMSKVYPEERNNIVIKALWSLFNISIGGFFWGILASKATFTRKQILIGASVAHGLVLLLASLPDLPFVIYITFYGLSGFFTAAVWPISRSIVADIFPMTSAGRIFGAMNAAFFFGSLISLELLLRSKARWGDTGWRACLFVQGVIVLLGTHKLRAIMLVPPVVPSHRSVRAEFQKLWSFIQMPSFFILAFQGCFGAIPWNIMGIGSLPWYVIEARTEFFKLSGVSEDLAQIIHVIGQLASVAGGILGGSIGDRLARRSLLHGRIWAAQITVFSGIPLAYVLYMLSPDTFMMEPWVYYLIAVIAFGLMTSWAYAATNPQIIFSLAMNDERTLAYTSHWCIEQACSSFGIIVFAETFGFSGSADEADSGETPLKVALFWTTCIPWLICGLLYSALHLTYPRDIEWIMRQSRRPSQASFSDVSVQGSEDLGSWHVAR